MTMLDQLVIVPFNKSKYDMPGSYVVNIYRRCQQTMTFDCSLGTL